MLFDRSKLQCFCAPASSPFENDDEPTGETLGLEQQSCLLGPCLQLGFIMSGFIMQAEQSEFESSRIQRIGLGGKIAIGDGGMGQMREKNRDCSRKLLAKGPDSSHQLEQGCLFAGWLAWRSSKWELRAHTQTLWQ